MHTQNVIIPFLVLLLVGCSSTTSHLSDQEILQVLDRVRTPLNLENYQKSKQLIHSLDDINYHQKGINETALYKIVITKAKNEEQQKHQLALATLILKKGGTPNTTNGTQHTPPIYHAKNEELFDLLIKYGARVNHRSEYVHPFDVISTFERVNKYIKFGFDFEQSDSNEFISAFLTSLDSDTFALLIRNNFQKANEYDDLGWTISHYVAAAIRVDLLRTAISENLNLNLPSLSENEGYYSFDKGIKKESDVLDIVLYLKDEYINEIGSNNTNNLISELKNIKQNNKSKH